MKRLWLIGTMGSGKTTSGRIAAEHLGVAFVDTDEMIESSAGMSVAEIWAAEGEAGFREREGDTVVDAARLEAIIATGGGAPLSESNRKAMTGSGEVVWLDVTAGAALSRLQPVIGVRPLLAVQDPLSAIARIDAERRSLYQSMATHHLLCDDRDAESVAAEIEMIWNS